MDIDALLAKLNPKTAASFRRASEVKNELLSTPSLGLNRAIGGVGYGRQSLIWGNRSSGKTLFCFGLAAEAQKQGRGVAWIDAERNFDPEWAARHGVDPNEMIISPITSIADMADMGHDLIKSGDIDLLVVDSISALLPQSYFVEGEMKSLVDAGQIGTFSKNMGSAVSMYNRVNEHTAVVLISQVRNNIGSYGASVAPMGGKAVEHMNSTQIKLWSNPSDKEAIKGKIVENDLIFEKPVGRPVTWTVEKNRGPGMHESNSYDMYFKGDFVGVDRVGEVVDYGVEIGVVKKGGAWYTIGDERFQGRAKTVQYLRDNPDLEEKIYGEILAKSI
jgi:recombination protein RecA